MISDKLKSHASRQQLFIIFIVALLLFMVLRWQPELWLAAQINNYAKQHAINISYKHLETRGFSVDIDHISIQAAQFSTPIRLDTLTLSPAWSSLLSATIGIDIHVTWREQHASAVISKQHDVISIQALKVALDATTLQPLLSKNIPLPVTFTGQIQAFGDIQFHAINGRPLLADLTLLWRSAAAHMPPSDMPLGDYTLTLKNDDANSPWQWHIDGGKALMLAGKGSLDATSNNPAAWTINGKFHLEASQEIPSLVSILGNNEKQFHVSGNILHPRLQPL